MEKIDFKKTYKVLYNASTKKVEIIDVPELRYIVFDGQGDPNSSIEFQEKIEAMYSIVYTLKFMLKFAKEKPAGYFDYVVPPFESLWWMDNMEIDSKQPDKWKWSLMIMITDYIDDKLIQKAIVEIQKKKDNKWLNSFRIEKIKAHQGVKIMHIGPYNEVETSILQLNDFIEKNNLKIIGKHHETYLSDPRRVSPEKLKTIVRHQIVARH
ncbi:MAG: hypothetical protein A2033_13605 [Bacteroidetes bacterium GWA2_31_9]|nr:MAG: hypothetical protein A2033_13605 [Bacteroidetes bacterium GWA2_31_9]